MQGYWTPPKFSLTEQLESESESEAGEEEYNFEGDYEAERGVHPKSKWTKQHVAKLFKDDAETQKLRNEETKIAEVEAEMEST